MSLKKISICLWITVYLVDILCYIHNIINFNWFLLMQVENVRNRMKMELVCDKKKYSKLVNKNTFKSLTIYGENLAAVHLNIDKLLFDKPIYVGFSRHIRNTNVSISLWWYEESLRQKLNLTILLISYN